MAAVRPAGAPGRAAGPLGAPKSPGAEKPGGGPLKEEVGDKGVEEEEEGEMAAEVGEVCGFMG